MVRFAAEFGMTVSSRGAIAINPGLGAPRSGRRIFSMNFRCNKPEAVHWQVTGKTASAGGVADALYPRPANTDICGRRSTQRSDAAGGLGGVVDRQKWVWIPVLRGRQGQRRSRAVTSRSRGHYRAAAVDPFRTFAAARSGQKACRGWVSPFAGTADKKRPARLAGPLRGRLLKAAAGVSAMPIPFYRALRRRPTNQPRPTSAEPSSVSEAGSGTAGVEVACKTAGRPLTSAYHRS